MSIVKANPALVDKLSVLLAETSPDFIVTGKILNRGIEADAKLSTFLLQAKTKQFKLKGMGLLSDSVRLEKRIESIVGEVGSGFTSIEQKQAQVLALMSADLDAVVGAKHMEVTHNGTSILSTEQKEALTTALVGYKKFLVGTVKPVVNRLAVTLGAATISEEMPAKVAVGAE